MGQNAFSHKFRTCPYHASRRRLDPSRRIGSLVWGPADRELRCTSTAWINVISPERLRKLARHAAFVEAPYYGCAWFGGARKLRRMWRVEEHHHRSVRPNLSLWPGELRRRVAPAAREKSVCKEGGSQASADQLQARCLRISTRILGTGAPITRDLTLPFQLRKIEKV